MEIQEMSFGDTEFDRAHDKRSDPAWMDNAKRHENALYIVFRGLNALVSPCSGSENRVELSMAAKSISMKLCKFTYKQLEYIYGHQCLSSQELSFIFLGIRSMLNNLNQEYYFACCLAKDAEELSEKARTRTPQNNMEVEGYGYYDLSLLAMHCSKLDCALVVQARPLIDWNRRYSYCASCGSTTHSKDTGHKRICSNEECLTQKGVHNTCFPRTDPAVIMVVISPDKQHCLLGRKSMYPDGVYSCLSGFVEPGETMEDAVRREVKEESAVSVSRVQYVSSQPWPYPSVLMLGCFAWATSTDIVVDKDELDDAKWFSKADVASAIKNPSYESGGLALPGSYTISRVLIDLWASGCREMSSL